MTRPEKDIEAGLFSDFLRKFSEINSVALTGDGSPEEEIKIQLEALKLVDHIVAELPVKYPRGSAIMFTNWMHDNTPAEPGGDRFYCCWYKKQKEVQSIVSTPPEWQNLSIEEADKICDMFDEPLSAVFMYTICQFPDGHTGKGLTCEFVKKPGLADWAKRITTSPGPA
jgi:hypothetical protein